MRPLSAPELGDIVGQDEAIRRLRRAMQAERLPHAFLFAGPAGVGRRTTAAAFAKVLLCEKPGEYQPDAAGSSGKAAGEAFRQACGRCDDCRMMAAGSHPDFHLVYKELARYHDDVNVRSRVMQDLGIDVIRSFLIAPAGRAASRGRGKVFVVLEAELLSAAAQNALLKTLEEPPPGVTIILVCTRPDQLLPTTLSRCAMVRFRLLPRRFVIDKLIEASVPPEEAAFWADFTEGSLGRAMRLAEQGMYRFKQGIVARLAKLTPAGDAELGEDLAKDADKLAVAAVAATRKAEGAELSKKLAARRAAGAMLELIAAAYSDALALACGAERPAKNADQLPAIKAIAARLAPTQLARIIQALSRYEQMLWRNVNQRIVWDNVVITCATGTGAEGDR